MGVLIGSAVAPIAMTLMWRKTNKWGAIAGAFLGQWCGLVAWVLFAKVKLADPSVDPHIGQETQQAVVYFAIALS